MHCLRETKHTGVKLKKERKQILVDVQCCTQGESLARISIWNMKPCLGALNARDVNLPTLTKGSNWQITQIWESCVFRLDLACSTSKPCFEQEQSSWWQIFKSRHTDNIALIFNEHDRHILLIYEKFHFQELLPFVKVGQKLLATFEV